MAEPRYKVRVADHEYWREQIKCQYACPVHTDARGYVRAIAAGDCEHAYLIARGPNPLASLCGRICGAPCEAACRRGTIDQPISIRALKRFVCEKFGSDARRDAVHIQLGNLYLKSRSREKCVRAYSEALRYAPEDPEIRSALQNQIQRVSREDLAEVNPLRDPHME